MKSWVSRPKVPGIHKIQVFKDTATNHHFPWVLIMPTTDMKSRRMTRYMNWKAAYDSAMTIQDLRNRNEP